MLGEYQKNACKVTIYIATYSNRHIHLKIFNNIKTFLRFHRSIQKKI